VRGSWGSAEEHCRRSFELLWMRRNAGLADVEVEDDAGGDDGIDLEGVQIASPFAQLGLQVVLDEDGDRVGGIGDIGAESLRLVVAGPSSELHVEGGCSGEGCADFERDGPVPAGAGDEAAPAGGCGEGGARSVEAERTGAGKGGDTEGGVGRGGVEGHVVEREAAARGDGGVGVGSILVVEEQAGAEAEPVVEGVVVDRGSGGGHVQIGVHVEAVGVEGGGVLEVVPGHAGVQMPGEVDGGQGADAERGDVGSEGQPGEGAAGGMPDHGRRLTVPSACCEESAFGRGCEGIGSGIESCGLAEIHHGWGLSAGHGQGQHARQQEDEGVGQAEFHHSEFSRTD